MTWNRHEDAQQYGSTLLVGSHVRLRALEEDDLADLTRWWRDPKWAVLQQVIVRPRRAEPTAEMFRNVSKSEASGDVGFSVVDRTSDVLVGHITLSGARLPTRAGALSVMIGGEHTRKGYGTDAVTVLTSYGFREMGLNRIEIHVHAFNSPARAVYRKVGYIEEGIKRQAIFHDGRFHDQVIMAALADEWSPR
mgnify:CR=1 FL=1